MLKDEDLMHNPCGLKEQARQKEIEHLDRSEGPAQAIESKMVWPKALPISKITNRKSSINEWLSQAFKQLLKPIFRHAHLTERREMGVAGEKGAFAVLRCVFGRGLGKKTPEVGRDMAA